MSKVVFEKRAVAFVDILGFKQIVEKAAISTNAEELNVLSALVETLESAIPTLNENVDKDVSLSLIPEHTSISDSIILSAPLSSTKIKNYDGLSVLVMRVIQLTHIFLSKGYLIRGGIDIGSVWHKNGNIIGPAYQNAYTIETRTKHPRVELSCEARKYWQENNCEGNFMCYEYQDYFMVNGVHSYYIQSKEAVIEKTLRNYKNCIEERRDENKGSAQKKWEWFNCYLGHEAKRQNIIL